MPRTAKEILQLKVNSLRGKVNGAQKCIDKLHNSLESIPWDINSVNMVLDDMILSVDEFVTNFDEMCARLNVSSRVSSSNTENADIVSRMNKLEEVVGVMRSTIHGGGDGEGSPHRGILSHLSVLENSVNDGKQKLISMEEKVQDISIFRNEMRAKTVKEDQQKEVENISFNKRIQSLEVENVTLTEEFKNLKGKLKEAIIENDCHVGVTSKDRVKDSENMKRFEKLENKVQVVISDTDVCKTKLMNVEEELKIVKTVVKIKEDPEKEAQNKYLNDKIEKLEKALETSVSATDACNGRLTNVEGQLKSGKKTAADGNRDKEIKGLKLQVANLDSLTKTQILERISVLENKSAVAFRVRLMHDGPWKDGVTIRGVGNVDFNVGNAFQESQCRFLAPVEGIYCFVLFLGIEDCEESTVKLQKYDVTNNEWKEHVWVVTAQRKIYDGESTNTCLIHLGKGEAVRARLYGEDRFRTCMVSGWLVTPTV